MVVLFKEGPLLLHSTEVSDALSSVVLPCYNDCSLTSGSQSSGLSSSGRVKESKTVVTDKGSHNSQRTRPGRCLSTYEICC